MDINIENNTILINKPNIKYTITINISINDIY